MITAFPIQRAVLGGRSGIQAALLNTAPPDPLAGITFALRLQTHAGFGATPDSVDSLFQDEAATILADEDGDPNAAFKGVLMGSPVKVTQADEQKQPLTLIENDKPMSLYDGVDDTESGEFTALTGATSFTVVVGFRRDSGNSNVFTISDGATSVACWIQPWTDGNMYIFIGGTSTYGTIPYTSTDFLVVTVAYDGSGATNADRLKVWVDGVSKTVSFVGTIPASVGTTDLLELGGTVLQGACLTGGIVSAFVATPKLSDPNRVLTETVAADLNP